MMQSLMQPFLELGYSYTQPVMQPFLEQGYGFMQPVMQTLMQPFFGAGLQLYAACNAALDAALFRAGFLLCAAFDAADWYCM